VTSASPISTVETQVTSTLVPSAAAEWPSAASVAGCVGWLGSYSPITPMCTTAAVSATTCHCRQAISAPVRDERIFVEAIISGHEGNRAMAHQHLDLAREVGEPLGEDRNDFDTEFGPTNVQLPHLCRAVDLG
jgi:hypothetical protein